MTSELSNNELENFSQLLRSLKNKNLAYDLVKGAAAETNGKIESAESLLSVFSSSEQLRQAMAVAFARWDQSEPSETFRFTKAFSQARRDVIYEQLGLPSTSHPGFDAAFSIADHGVNEVEIVFAEWDPWYEERPIRSSFYWDAYESVLSGTKGWGESAVRNLDLSTEKVVGRLASPTSNQPYQAKGLVVGHVQSGKTAHFTGVIAKSIDAGYRLIIVLAGMHNILRDQTQRRLDMELVGRQNIVRGRDENAADQRALIDYARSGDLDWSKGNFVVHEVDPWTEPEIPRIHRLTSSDSDYKPLKQGLSEIEFNPIKPELPLYDVENLKRENVRLVVVKKNKMKLDAFINDLKAQRVGLGNVPALIIDDESDQASINTVNPGKALAQEKQERTAINRLITDMLELMPRAQYVAYTATPFANVFVDADDAEDLFPKDFIFGLEAPKGYMGGRDFHDFAELPDGEEPSVANRNQLAYVREIDSYDEESVDDSMQSAIDSFVLSGAIKLWRASQPALGLSFQHHTMLVHESVKVIEHRFVAERVRRIWNTSGFDTYQGLERLRRLYEEDFLPVSEARADSSEIPISFDEISEFVADAIQNIAPAGDPVVIVNGENNDDYNKVSFDSGPFWRILVGGSKLSRGFTVEGLTVSFYRRPTGQEDTLMQMGRWFGYRRGYRDLIRLFIDKKRKVGAREFDLYEAFGSIVQGEEKFREQLSLYSLLDDDGRPTVQPYQVPPLVPQSAEFLTPTARNKMFNASIVSEGQTGQIQMFGRPQLPAQRSTAHYENLQLVKPWLKLRELREIQVRSFRAKAGVVSATEFIALLANFAWLSPDLMDPKIAFFKMLNAQGRFEDMIVVLPQRKMDVIVPQLGADIRISTKSRRTDRPEFSLPNDTDRPILQMLNGKLPSDGYPELSALARPKRGVVMVEFALEDGQAEDMSWVTERDVATILTVGTPFEENSRPEIGWRYHNPSRETDVVVDI